MGLTGKTEQVRNTSGGTSALNDQLAQWLLSVGGRGGTGFGGSLFPSVVPDQASLQPYLDLFTVQNARNMAQAKESAGNLTGSGFANTLGARTAEANTQQSAFLADLMEKRRTEDANRFLATLMGTMGSPAAGVTTMYQPGFLESLMGGISGLAGGGAFNGLFPWSGGGGTSGKMSK